jgi:hypothetical protein
MDSIEQLINGFVIPTRPDVAPVQAIHRGHDGFITFHRKEKDGAFKNLFAIRAAEIEAYFPQVLNELLTDSYFSLNGYWGIDRRKGVAEFPEPYKHRVRRLRENLRCLTSCYVDLDCYKRGISTGTAIGMVIDLQDAGRLPPASLLMRSGRGVWCVWMLRDRQFPDSPQRAFHDQLATWYAVQREFGVRTAEIGYDAASSDAARVTRVPGSVHSQSQLPVSYWFQTSANGSPYVYTLAELMASLGIVSKRPSRLVIKHERKVARAGCARSLRGWNARWIKARRQFLQLWNMRGTFAEGTRNSALFVYAVILHFQRLERDVIADELWRLFADLQQPPKAAQPYMRGELHAVFRSTTTPKRYNGGIRNQTIADLLRVTPEEAAHLESWPAASVFRALPVVKQTQRERARLRLLELNRLLNQRGDVPTLAFLRACLVEVGLDATERTIANDLARLGVTNPRSRTRRRSRLPETHVQLFPGT